MSIEAISSSSSLLYQAQAANQTQETNTQSSSSSIGQAAVLDLSGTANGSSSAVSGIGQSGSGGSSGSATNSCPLGNSMCLGCGQCGKTTTTGSASNSSASNLFAQDNASEQTTPNALTAMAVNAYTSNSVVW
jgi:hypothetical protein